MNLNSRERNGRTEAVDAGGRGGPPGADGDSGRRRQSGETRKEGAPVRLRGVAVERVRGQRGRLRHRHEGGDAHRDRLQADHEDPALQDPLQLEEEVRRGVQVRLPGLGGVRPGDGQEEQDGQAQASAHGRHLRPHRHSHQALWESAQDQAARRKEAKEGGQEEGPHPNGLMDAACPRERKDGGGARTRPPPCYETFPLHVCPVGRQ